MLTVTPANLDTGKARRAGRYSRTRDRQSCDVRDGAREYGSGCIGGYIAAGRNHGAGDHRAAQNPDIRADISAEPMSGISRASSGPESRPVMASRSGPNSALPFTPVRAVIACVQPLKVV